MSFRVYLWLGFLVAILAMLALDLGLARRGEGGVTARRAVRWTAIWVGLSLALCAGIAVFWGHEKGLQFLSGYLIEYSLSVDNLFVFLLIFRFFRIESRWQHKLLFWGVLGAFVMRAGLILTGVALVERFEWLYEVFGVFLAYTALKLVLGNNEAEIAPEGNPVIRLVRRLWPVAEQAPEGRFTVREGGRWMITPLFVVLIFLEMTDLLFAFDSIPAVLGVSRDRFILFSSNACAVLGLRSLFFLVAALIERLRYLQYALAAVLGFIAAKMLIRTWVEIPTLVSLAVIGSLLGVAVVASVLRPETSS